MALTNVFTGAHGTLSLSVAGTDAEAAEFTPVTDAYGSLEGVGRVTDVEVCVQTELEEFHELGKRHPVSLHPGNIHINGKIGRAYINGALVYLLMGRGASETQGGDNGHAIPRFVLTLALDDPARPGNTLKVSVFGVRFENWGLRVPQDDIILEHITFKGKSIGITDAEDSNEITVSFPEES